VVFSAATIFNVANAYLFHRRSAEERQGEADRGVPVERRAGERVPEQAGDAEEPDRRPGNLVSARNQRHGLPVATVNAYGMLIGAALVAGVAAVM
jgi:hypothetical protein